MECSCGTTLNTECPDCGETPAPGPLFIAPPPAPRKSREALFSAVLASLQGHARNTVTADQIKTLKGWLAAGAPERDATAWAGIPRAHRPWALATAKGQPMPNLSLERTAEIMSAFAAIKPDGRTLRAIALELAPELKI